MMFTSEMIQLFAVVLGRDSQRVTEALLREGVMQFINISEVEGEKPDSQSEAKPDASLSEISDLRKRIEVFLHTGGIIPVPPNETDLANRISVNIEKEKQHLDKIASERESLRERQRTIQQEILKLEDIRKQVELYGLGLSDIPLHAKHSFISMQTGKLPVLNTRQLEDDLKDFPSLNIALGKEGDIAHYLLISMKRDTEQIGKILIKSGWTQVELPNELQSVKEDVFKELSVKLEKLIDEQKKFETKAYDLVKREEKYLRDVWVNLRVNELFHVIQTNFKSSSRTVIFSGWLPLSKKEKLTETIKKASENRCYLEWTEVQSKDIIADQVPVQFNNPKILAPFQMLVSNFGVPKYGTIDPTPFVMPIYLSMFGLMFADIGQGFILSLLGILGVRFLKNNEQNKGLRDLSWLIIWCGLSSMLFGALFGSFFGTALFKPLWFDFHGIISGHSSGNSAINNVYDILSVTLYFGITVIFLGLLFNWINIIRTGRWMELFFDKGGILGGWIYAGGIYIASYMVGHNYKEFPPGIIMFLLVGLPSLLIFIKEPYHYLKHRSGHSDEKFNPLVILNFLMQWIVELLEIFSGYLSNTLSFMRVAGLGIAHVCLMISFFTLAEMTSGIGSVLILMLGNILVIGLEGLSAGIQALRLNYYEFFTKFFHGTGKLYTPISLGNNFN
ncbi:MAG: V-type ATPase 116kDa subunit family protein [Sedimentisphaerales bacterium]|nr:V-type ATPase 116kDa subunit family protein [Sedimentisphaerales bacterium]